MKKRFPNLLTINRDLVHHVVVRTYILKDVSYSEGSTISIIEKDFPRGTRVWCSSLARGD